MNWTKDQFQNLTYNCYSLDATVSMLKAFPAFNKMVEFHISYEHVTLDQVIRYMIYMYDPMSPLQAITDINVRKSEATQLAGITFTRRSRKRYPKEFENVLCGSCEKFNRMAVAYIRSLKKPLWQYIVVLEKRYYNLAQKMMDPEQEVNTKDLQATYAELEKKTSEFLAQDNNQKMLEQLYDLIIKEEVNFSPEAVAEKLAKGEKPFSDI